MLQLLVLNEVYSLPVVNPVKHTGKKSSYTVQRGDCREIGQTGEQADLSMG